MPQIARGTRCRLQCPLLLTTVAVADDEPYLFSIPVERAGDASGTLDENVFATLHVPDSERLANALDDVSGIEVVATRDGEVTVELGGNATRTGTPTPTHSEPTFVVDYDEPDVANLQSVVRGQLGDDPDLDALTEFVFDHIDDKTYIRSFDFASRVARTGEGDCTEHAVLLAALARANGLPARVVMGVLLVDEHDTSQAYGHAWTEVFDGAGWQIADATLPDRDAVGIRLRYLPLLSLDDEGPGYSLDMMRIARVQPARISGIRNATALDSP